MSRPRLIAVAALAASCVSVSAATAPANDRSGKDVVEAGKRLGLQTVLAAMQILDQSLSRMRMSTQARILAELALVRRKIGWPTLRPPATPQAPATMIPTIQFLLAATTVPV